MRFDVLLGPRQRQSGQTIRHELPSLQARGITLAQRVPAGPLPELPPLRLVLCWNLGFRVILYHAGAVDLRTTSSGSTAISGWNSPRFSMRASNVSAAMWPIFLSGWRTLVKLGIQKIALAISSNPTTETSSGTRTPAS